MKGLHLLHIFQKPKLFLVSFFFTALIFSISAPQAHAAFNYVTQWGSAGTGDGQFDQVWGIAVDSAGNVYVSDGNNDRVQKFDSDGNFILEWGTTGTGNGEFQEPTGIAVNSLDEVIVSDLSNFRVQVFNTSGTYIRQLGFGCGGGPGEFCNPWGVAVDSANNMYISDGSGATIHKYTRLGAYVTGWGSSGSGDGQFTNAVGLAIDSSGNVYAADAGTNDRIQKFSSGGTYLTQWGGNGSGNGQFDEPWGVAIDADDNVFVVDNGNNRVQQFDTSGNYVDKWGTPGTGPGEFPGPRFIALNDSGYIYVGDSTNRVQKFFNTTFVGPTPTPTPTPTPGSGSNSSGGGQVGPPGPCTASIPTSAPNFYQLKIGQGNATLFFTPIAGSVTGYVISYGTGPNANDYSVLYNTTYTAGAITYTVNGLVPNLQYYFRVRAQNSCQPGTWSATLTGTSSVNSINVIDNIYPPTPTVSLPTFHLTPTPEPVITASKAA